MYTGLLAKERTKWKINHFLFAYLCLCLVLLNCQWSILIQGSKKAFDYYFSVDYSFPEVTTFLLPHHLDP